MITLFDKLFINEFIHKNTLIKVVTFRETGGLLSLTRNNEYFTGENALIEYKNVLTERLEMLVRGEL